MDDGKEENQSWKGTHKNNTIGTFFLEKRKMTFLTWGCEVRTIHATDHRIVPQNSSMAALSVQRSCRRGF